MGFSGASGLGREGRKARANCPGCFCSYATPAPFTTCMAKILEGKERNCFGTDTENGVFASMTEGQARQFVLK